LFYVHGQEQPTLIVNDLKSGAQGKGGVAVWIELHSQVAEMPDGAVADPGRPM
jgi:hypothetical protein